MPIEIGEIVGTSPSDVLSTRPSRARRRSRDESVDDYLDEEFLSRAHQIARLQFAMTGEARAARAAQMTESKMTSDTVDSFTKVIRNVSARDNPSPEARRKLIADFAETIADPVAREFVLNKIPDVVFDHATTSDEADDLLLQTLRRDRPDVYAFRMAKKEGLVPPERDIPGMTARELESAYDEIKAEVDNTAGVGLFTLAKKVPPGTKPTTVHRMLNKTIEELPLGQITDQQIYVAAQLNRRRMLEEINPERTMGVAESAFLDSLRKQTKFNERTKELESQEQTLSEVLGPGNVPSQYGAYTVSQFEEHCDNLIKAKQITPELASLYRRVLAALKE